MPHVPATGGQSQRVRLWHPYLIALFPAASIYAANVSAIEVRDLLWPCLAVLVFAFTVYFVVRRWCNDPEKAAILSSWTIGSFFCYGVVAYVLTWINRNLLGGLSSAHGIYVLPTWIALWVLGNVGICLFKRSLKPVNRFLNVMSPIMLLIVGANITLQWQALAAKDKASTLDNWVPSQVELTKPVSPPDIYYLVFDRYASAETLRKCYDLDNSEFLEQLRSRGFIVALESHANYPHTNYSMCSALNLSLLPETRLWDSYYARMIDNQLVACSLQRLGYKFYHYGNWYQPLRTNSHADEVLPLSILPSEFADALYATTPVSKILRVRKKYGFVTDKFKRIADLAKEPSPKFVYAHFLLPHPPFVMDSDGSQLPWSQKAYGSPKDGYVRQLKGTNRYILQMIDRLVQDSSIPPIIVLQADEGPYLNEKMQKLDDEEKIRVRSGILSAFLLPPTANQIDVSPRITPVNTFRLIFHDYFSADLELLPNRTFYWSHPDARGRPSDESDRFLDVTDQIFGKS